MSHSDGHKRLLQYFVKFLSFTNHRYLFRFRALFVTLLVEPPLSSDLLHGNSIAVLSDLSTTFSRSDGIFTVIVFAPKSIHLQFPFPDCYMHFVILLQSVRFLVSLMRCKHYNLFRKMYLNVLFDSLRMQWLEFDRCQMCR